MAKYILLAGLLLIGCPLMLSAQCVGTVNGVSSNPESPFNPQCGDNPTNPELNPFLNDFDWRDAIYPHGTGGTETIESPFENSEAFRLRHLWNTASFPLTALDYQPEDGWELLLFRPSNNTHLVLYNKYTSILRVLFYLRDNGNFDDVNAQLQFTSETNEITALLHPTTGQSQPLDQPSTGLAQTYVPNTNSDDVFMYFDLPVEYDPCTCVDNISTMQISFSKINEMELEMYGRYLEVSQDLASIEENGELAVGEDFLTQAYLVDNAQDVAGAHTFNRYDDLVTQYEGLKEEQAKLAKKYQFYKWFGDIVGLAAKGPIFKSLKLFSVTYNKDTIKGKPGEILDFIAGATKLLGAPIKKKLDGVTGRVNRLGATNFAHGEMVLNGSITDQTDLGNAINFLLPGSAAANSCDIDVVEIYPKYNEILGRFALLETPVLRYESARIPPSIRGATSRAKLDLNSIKYALNPAANIAETEIWGSLQFTRDETHHTSAIVGGNLNIIDEEFPSATLSTELMPLSCLSEYVSDIRGAANVLDIIDVKLTIAVEYVFEGIGSDGETPRALQFYHYPVEVVGDYVGDIGDLSPEFANAPDYENELILGTTNFTADATIFAWNSIIIEGDITVAPGVQVDIIAPTIQIIADSWIDPDIDLYNDFTPFSCEPIEPESADAVASFCASGRYQANNAIQQLRQLDPGIPEPEHTLATSDVDLGVGPVNAKITPNPVGESLGELLIELEVADQVSASLHDMTGRQLDVLLTNQWLNEGTHRFDLPTEGLPAGNYFVRIEYVAGTQVVRFVK